MTEIVSMLRCTPRFRNGSFATEPSGLQRIPMSAMVPIDGVIGRGLVDS